MFRVFIKTGVSGDYENRCFATTLKSGVSPVFNYCCMHTDVETDSRGSSEDAEDAAAKAKTPDDGMYVKHV